MEVLMVATASQYTEGVRSALQKATSEAYLYNHERIHPEHILLAFIKQQEPAIAGLVCDWDMSENKLYQAVENRIPVQPNITKFQAKLPHSRATESVLELAKTMAKEAGCALVGPEHVLIGILLEGENPAAQALLSKDVYEGEPPQIPLTAELFRQKIAARLNWAKSA